MQRLKRQASDREVLVQIPRARPLKPPFKICSPGHTKQLPAPHMQLCQEGHLTEIIGKSRVHLLWQPFDNGSRWKTKMFPCSEKFRKEVPTLESYVGLKWDNINLPFEILQLLSSADCLEFVVKRGCFTVEHDSILRSVHIFIYIGSDFYSLNNTFTWFYLHFTHCPNFFRTGIYLQSFKNCLSQTLFGQFKLHTDTRTHCTIGCHGQRTGEGRSEKTAKVKK